MNMRGERRRKRKILLAALIITIFWLGLALVTYSTAIQVDDTALSIPFAAALKPVTRTVLTQGWGFFTRSPQEQDFYIFGRDDIDSWTNISYGPPGRVSSLFGLKRVSRAEGVEIGVLSYEVPVASWEECLEPMPECFEGLESFAIRNLSHAPLICGEAGLALSAPSPWAWQRLSRAFVMPSTVVRLKVEC